MTANVENGAYLSRPAWHGLGTVIEPGTTIREAFDLSGLNFEVEKVPLSMPNGQRAGDAHGLVRFNDDGTHNYYATVGDRYEVFQYSELLDFAERIIEHYDFADPDALVSLANGKRGFLSFRVGGFNIDGDKMEFNQNFGAGHGGKGIEVFGSARRPECDNMYTQMVGEARKGGSLFTAKHTGSLSFRLDLFADSFNAGNQERQEFEDFCRRMAGWKNLTGEQLNSMVNNSFSLLRPEPPKDADDKKKTRWLRAKMAFGQEISRVLNSKTCQTSATKGTAYGVWNAITEYMDFDMPKVVDRATQRFDPRSVNSKRKAQLQEQMTLALTS